MILGLPLEKVSWRDGNGSAVHRQRHHDQAIAGRIRERIQQDSVDEAENGRRRTDAQGEREDRDGAESRTPAECPHGIVEIAADLVEPDE